VTVRRDIFNAAARAADLNRGAYAGLGTHVRTLGAVLTEAGRAFALSSAATENAAMKEAFQNVLAEGIAALRDFGADGKSRPSDEDIFSALDAERQRQARDPLHARGRVLRAAEDVLLMQSIFLREVDMPPVELFEARNHARVMKGVAAIAAVALRGGETLERPALRLVAR
jgi:hypothetical protein